MKEESEEAGLKLNIQEIKIMASSPITSWQIDGETMETVTTKSLQMLITARKLKVTYFLGKSYDKPRQHIKTSDITLLRKISLVKAMVFPVAMYGWGRWKKAEWCKIDAFELWYWRRLFRVPWTARRSNQSILKELSPEYSLEDWCWNWNSDTLATWWEELTHWKRPWCWARLKGRGEGVDRGWDGWMASATGWTWVWASSRSWWWTKKSGMLQSMGSQRVGHDLVWTATKALFRHEL